MEHVRTGFLAPAGGTTEFRKSNAYKNLRDKFEELQIDASNFALVMPFYPFTLKYLLERTIDKSYKFYWTEVEKLISDHNMPAGCRGNLHRIAFREFGSRDALVTQAMKALNVGDLNLNAKEVENGLKDCIGECIGYDILRAMSFKDRIETILPFIDSIARGIKTLHSAGMYHLDLKPANIFVDYKGGIVDSVVGDLGFLIAHSQIGTQVASSNKDLPLGTRHYRSPEQKDFFDLGDVKVSRCGSESGIQNAGISLEIRDPKFADSIIEPGDYLVFSKDSDRLVYTIDQINSKKDCRIIDLKCVENLLGRIPEDERTQVMMYKNQGPRTDLFGFGAILFELLTCGKSPERFYDNLRAYDTETEKVERILENYKKVMTFQSNEPSIINVFGPFRHDVTGDYAPADIVELILRCMLYKASGTFYEENKAGASSQLVDRITRLQTERVYVATVRDNPLLQSTPHSSASKTARLLNDALESIQKFETKDISRRLQDGTCYFWSLFRLVSNQVEENAKDDGKKYFVFSELTPDNIFVEGEPPNEPLSRLVNNVYTSVHSYVNDIETDNFYTKLYRNFASPFVPKYFWSLRRIVRLKRNNDASGRAKFGYAFQDASPFGDRMQIGDWLVQNRKAWSVVESDNHTLVASYESGETIPDDNEPVVYYSHLGLNQYYLHMLGTYLYQIFFVGLESNSRSVPARILIAESELDLGVSKTVSLSGALDRLLKIRASWQFSKRLEWIYQYFANLYLRLVLHRHPDSFYSQIENRKMSRLNALDFELKEMIKAVAVCIKVDAAQLTRLQAKAPTTEGLVADSRSVNLNMNHLLGDVLNPSLISRIKKLSR